MEHFKNLVCFFLRKFGIVDSMPPIDPVKITNKVNELNLKDTNNPYWIPVDGYNAITGMNIQGPQISFNPNVGVPVKIFVNARTGEIKTFDARAFTVQPPIPTPTQNVTPPRTAQ